MKKRNKEVAPSSRMKSIVKTGKEKWVTAQKVTEITEWHWTDLISHREEGNLTVKKVGAKSYRYDLESVLDLFGTLKKFELIKAQSA